MNPLLLLSCGSLFALALCVLLTAWAFRAATFRRWSVRETLTVVLARVGAWLAFPLLWLASKLKP